MVKGKSLVLDMPFSSSGTLESGVCRCTSARVTCLSWTEKKSSLIQAGSR
jgi:hypothetical protein